MIEFISHEEFPDDPYIKEIIYLSIDPKFRFAYARKLGKNGQMFWGTLSTATTLNGQRKYHDAIMWDSNFFRQDILAFLDARSWENNSRLLPLQYTPPPLHRQDTQQQASFLDDCPF